ncbi:MAG: hypothetical protein OEW67_10250 [Cyclobacteriaceae bacterium]|nr:hypothetical protein [Cyclobacteriaceae bacterium]
MIATAKKEKTFANLCNVNSKKEDQILCFSQSLIEAEKERERKKEKALIEIRKALSEISFS